MWEDSIKPGIVGILAYGLTGLGFLLPLYFVLWIFTSIVLTWFAEIHWRKR